MPLLTKRVLTEEIIASAPRPEAGFVELRDAAAPGMALRVYSTGSSRFSYEYRSPRTGKMARITMLATNLAEARLQIANLRQMVRRRKDPRDLPMDEVFPQQQSTSSPAPALERVLEAARKAGAKSVEIARDGSVKVIFF